LPKGEYLAQIFDLLEFIKLLNQSAGLLTYITGLSWSTNHK